MARTGIDEFYETLRLLLAKFFAEQSGYKKPLNCATAQALLAEHHALVKRFVEGKHQLSAPPDVVDVCLQTLQCTALHGTPYAILHAAFEQMTARHFKAEKGQYFTPSYVVDFCIAVLRLEQASWVCDPACGSGAFLHGAYQSMGQGNICGFDISLRAIKTAKLLSYLTCNDAVILQRLDALIPEHYACHHEKILSIENFMRTQCKAFTGFDVIVTNPPFAGTITDLCLLDDYKVASFKAFRAERDTLFLERCLTLLKPGGRLAMIMPDNKFSGAKFAGLRRWLLDQADILAVVSLHPYTFRPFTSQKACVLFLQKGRSADRQRPILFYKSNKAGKLSNGDLVMTAGKIDHDLDCIAKDLIEAWHIG